MTSPATTPRTLASEFEKAISDSDHYVAIDNTGGGCLVIGVYRNNTDDQPYLWVSPSDGPFGSGWEDDPIDENHAEPDLFMVNAYGGADDPDDAIDRRRRPRLWAGHLDDGRGERRNRRDHPALHANWPSSL